MISKTLYWLDEKTKNSKQLRLSLTSALAAVIAIWIANFCHMPNAFWAGISAFVVIQADAAASLKRGLHRIAGTIIGALSGVVLISLFGFAPWVVVICIF